MQWGKAVSIVEILRERVAALPKPCSLVECGLGPEEEVALRQWASQAGLRHLRVDPQGFGLGFLVGATLAAREKAGEHQLWPHVHAWFRGSPAVDLFTPQYQPVTELKDAVELAARRLELRHGFDRSEGEQRWYLTVLLQCGFTKPGLHRLPNWLSGDTPWAAVDMLLHDADLSSEGFCETFERLRVLRLGWCDSIPHSPWLGGDLGARAREAARSRLSLGTAAAPDSVVSSRARLVFAPSSPAFRLPLHVPLPSVGARSLPHLDFEIAGTSAGRTLLQPDGTFSSVPDAIVPLRSIPSTGRVAVRLLDPAGVPVHTEEVELFAGGEDVDLFVPAGGGDHRRAIDPWTEPAPRRAAVVRVADDLRIEGSFAAPPVTYGGSRWQRIEPQEMATARVPIADEIAWTFLPDGRPTWHVEVHAAQQPWSPGVDLVWTVRGMPSRARVVSACLGRRALVVERISDGVRVVLRGARYLPMSSGLRMVVVDGGNQHTIVRAAPYPECRHFLTRTGEGWQKVTITDRASLECPVRWFGRAGADGDVPWLFEGRRPVGPLGEREVRLAPHVSALGGRLVVKGRQFNHDGGDVEIVDSLVDSKWMRSLVTSDGYATITLDARLAWSDELSVTVLGVDGIPRAIDQDELMSGDGQLLIATPVSPAAAAIVCRGEPLAAIATERLVAAIEAAPDATACLRWLFVHRLPVARRTVRDALVRLVRRQPLQAAALGFSADPPPPLLRDEFLAGLWRECFEESLDIVEAAISGTRDGRAGIAILLGACGPIARGLNRVAKNDPVLAARVLRAALRSMDPMVGRMLAESRADLDALTAPAPSGMADLAASLSKDEGFGGFLEVHRRNTVAWAVDGATIDRKRVGNVRRLFYLPEFRHAVAADALRRLIRR